MRNKFLKINFVFVLVLFFSIAFVSRIQAIECDPLNEVSRCMGEKMWTCGQDKQWHEGEPCPNGCNSDQTECKPLENPCYENNSLGKKRCVDGYLEECKNDGFWTQYYICPTGECNSNKTDCEINKDSCLEKYELGESRCINNKLESCTDNGTWEEYFTCETGCNSDNTGCALKVSNNIPDYPVGVNFRFKNATVGSIVSELLDYVFVIAGIILLVMLVMGGLGLMTAAGNPDKMKSGYGKITNALIGFLIVFVSYFVVQLVEAILGIKIM